eukprot:12514808-Alexandrium_andersonii.AAC.1
MGSLQGSSLFCRNWTVETPELCFLHAPVEPHRNPSESLEQPFALSDSRHLLDLRSSVIMTVQINSWILATLHQANERATHAPRLEYQTPCT